MQRAPLAPHVRHFHLTRTTGAPASAPKTKDRGPPSEEDTQTDFGALDILSGTPTPTTAIDACTDNGFALNSGLKVRGSGVLLVGGEAFKWRPWAAARRTDGTAGAGGGGGSSGEEHRPGRHDGSGTVTNAKGQFEVDEQAWGVFDLVWPKPDLLIIGTGPSMMPLSPATRRHIYQLGIRVEVQDTRNAAAQFNLLATERGVQQVVAALVPIGWRA